MEFSAKQIAGLLGGSVEGNEEVTVNQLSKIEEGKPGSLSFLANPKYTEYIYSTKASVVIISKEFSPEQALPTTLTLVKVDDPYAGFATLLEAYNQLKHSRTGIDEKSHVSDSATVGEGSYIGAFVFVGENSTIGKNVKIYPNSYIGDNVSIGDNTLIHPGVQVNASCVVGTDCVFHSGAIIGSDGFGFAPNAANNYHKVPQTGNVLIEDHVEIGANTTIDRATLGSTIIRKGVKLDNLIQIAHNVEIGENTVIAAQTGVAGSTKIGRDCMIGGQVGIIGHLSIADEVKIAAQSGIGSDITEKGAIVQGSPAFAIGDYKRSYVLFRSLPKLKQGLDELKQTIKKLNQDN